MTEPDELFVRLNQLSSPALDPEFSASVQRLSKRRLRSPARSAPLASFAVAATVIVYLGWALRFTSALYR